MEAEPLNINKLKTNKVVIEVGTRRVEDNIHADFKDLVRRIKSNIIGDKAAKVKIIIDNITILNQKLYNQAIYNYNDKLNENESFFILIDKYQYSNIRKKRQKEIIENIVDKKLNQLKEKVNQKIIDKLNLINNKILTIEYLLDNC